jgi:hypothetical protein
MRFPSMNNELWHVFWDRRFWRGPAPCTLLLLGALNVGVWHLQTRLAEERRSNLTAGDQSAFQSSSRCDTTYGEAPLSTWNTIPDATDQRLVILSGMSQMFSIPERQPGDQTTSEEMDDRLAPKGIRVYGLAAPNLCNEEALFILLALLEKPQTTPKFFIFGACFDKMRNLDLRPGYREFLWQKPGLQETWKRMAETYRQRYPHAAEKMLKTFDDLRASRTSTDSFEDMLRDRLAEWLPLVAFRKELNGRAQQFLYEVRNELLRIKTSSKRPIIKSRYEMNQEFLQMMIDVCADSGVQFITYVVPLNPLAENPYVPAEYVQFKDWISQLAERRQVPFANLENAVPSQDWGIWFEGPDFKHFKGAGHRRTAAKLLEEFGSLLSASGARETTR